MESNAKLDLYSFVETLRAELKIHPSKYPINIINICNNDCSTELLYHPFKTHGICGTALIGEKSDTIILNSKRNIIEQNFDCGHEIIHCKKHSGYEVKCFNCFESVLPQQSSFLEWEANEGSAELLVPYKLLLPIILRNRQILSFPPKIQCLKRKLACEFLVTNATIFYRLESLKYEINQYLNGVSLNEIELLSDNCLNKRGITVKSLNNLKEN